MKTTSFPSIWTSLFLLCVFAAPLTAEQFGLFSYRVQGDEITITDYPEAAVGEIEVPAEIDGLPVTRIDSWAFYGCTGLTSVTIPNSVTSIGSTAFSSCSGLTSIAVAPGNARYASEEGVLFEFAQTRLIRCPGGKAGVYAIPGSVTEIGSYAFYDCSGLTSVTIPNSVTTIDNEAFADCSGLTSVTIPNSVTTISREAFSGCRSLTSIAVAPGNARYASEEGVLLDFARTTLINYPEGKAGEYTIPDSVTTIGWVAFSGCSGLTSVTIPNSVTTIGWAVFSRCRSLTSIAVAPGNVHYASEEGVLLDFARTTLIDYPEGKAGEYTIPDSVTTIGDGAFSGCRSLTSIAVAPGNVHYASEEGVLLDFARTTLIDYPEGKAGEYTIPDSVTTIGERAFSGCSSLTSVTIPNSVTAIRNDAFYGCTGLTSVTIPNSVTTIFWKAFSGCTGLTSVTIPNSVTGIGDRAFSGCSSLTSVTIPNRVTAIWEAFSGCTGLTSVTIPNSVTTIGERAFEGCSSLTSVTIPNSVTTIGDVAFMGCSSLTSVTIPNSVTTIGEAAFSGCSGLTSVTIPNSVTTLGYNAFTGCSSLTSVTIPNSVTAIRNDAFSGCSSLRSVTIPNSVTTIRNGAFEGCSSLRSVTIPNSVTTIGNAAFSGCSSLRSVTIPNSVTTIGSWAFSGCSSLTNVTIPNRVTTIGDGAFRGCRSLTSVTIPNSVTTIGGEAFYNCTGLTSIAVAPENAHYASEEGVLFDFPQTTLIRCPEGKAGAYAIPSSVTTIGEAAFSGCSGLTSVTIPNSVTTLGYNAFTGCRSLAVATFLGHAPIFPFTDWLEERPHYRMAPDFNETAPDFTTYYLSRSTGFTSPEWGGYPARRIDSDPVVDERGLSLSFRAIPGLSLTSETSIDLKTWTTEGVILSEIDQNDRRTATIRRDGTNRFLRLVVEE